MSPPSFTLYGLVTDNLVTVTENRQKTMNNVSIVKVDPLPVVQILEVDEVIGDELPNGLHMSSNDG